MATYFCKWKCTQCDAEMSYEMQADDAEQTAAMRQKRDAQAFAHEKRLGHKIRIGGLTEIA